MVSLLFTPVVITGPVIAGRLRWSRGMTSWVPVVIVAPVSYSRRTCLTSPFGRLASATSFGHATFPGRWITSNGCVQPLVVLLLGAMVGYLGFPASGTRQLKVLRFALAGSQGGHSLDSGIGLPSFSYGWSRASTSRESPLSPSPWGWRWGRITYFSLGGLASKWPPPGALC